MAKKRTWLWILVGVFGLAVVCMLALAGAGIYFVSSHVHARPTSSADAFQSFDEVKASFKDQKPVFDLDVREQPKQVRSLADMPTSSNRPQDLWILAWDPDRERLVRVSVPFWVLRLGKRKIDLFNGDRGFSLDRLQLDTEELQRVGPQLLIDYRTPTGERVLIWTR
jgi:hypothetical protein